MAELEAFRGAEERNGVSVWRIENFKPVAQPTADYGHFASGDSYIVLNVFEQRKGLRSFHIHFWLGNETTKDESGTAAFLSAQLDEMLGGSPVQFRELQGQESEAFLRLFKNGVHYEKGGVASGFSKAQAEKHETRLLHIRGVRAVRVAEVPVKVESLNHGDCFVVDDGLEIFQWNGRDASAAEKAKTLNVTTSIKNDLRKGKAIIHMVEDGDYTSEAAKHMFALLGAKDASKVKIADSVSKATEGLFQAPKLYMVEGSDFNEVKGAGGKGFHRSDLNSEHLFIVHAGGKIYVWIGDKVDADSKKKAFEVGSNFLDKKGLATNLQIQVVKEKMESPMFKDNFQQWDAEVLKERVTQAKTKEERAEVDISGLVQGLTAQATKQLSIDDGSGSVKVWRVEEFNLVDWPEDKYGHFYAGDSYVVKYTYHKGGTENVILYFWQGRDSSTDEKGASALLASQLDAEMGGTPTQVRLLQNKEPDHFFQIFHGGVIVHLGGLNNEDEGKEGPNKEQLYQIKGYNALDTHAVQVRTVASSLNSGDSYVVVDAESVTVWHGKLCSDEEKAFAVAMADKLAEGKSTSTVEEGSEDDAFWAKLGGKGDYPQVGDLPPPENPARLFQISDSMTGGHGISVDEIFDFDQEDLCDEDVMLLDTYKEVFVWVGHNSRENEKTEGTDLARKYLEESNKHNGRDPETPISVVHSGKEPPTFTCHFLGWDDTRAAEFEDPYTAKLKLLKSAEKKDSELEKLAAERRKKFVDPLAAKKATAAPTEPATPPLQAESAPADDPEEFKFKPLVHFFPLAELKDMRSDAGIDVTRKEDYLSEEEFAEVMGLTRAEFQGLAAWRKKQKKQAIGIF